MDVDTRVLRYFVAVAEHLNFTRAAEQLFISQPALSRQIRQLETELRTPLLERTSREVRLTPAGEELLPAARRLITDWQTAQRAARTVAAAASQVLRIGFVATGAGPLTTRARTLFAGRHPEVTVEPKRFDWGGEVAALRDGLVDVAFLWLPADTTGLRVEVIAEERRMVALARDHRLAAQPDVSILDLNPEPLGWTRRAPRPWVDWWAVNPRPDGTEPLWGPENDNVEEMLEHVAAEAAISIGSESMAAYYARPDLVWRPIRDVPPLRIGLGTTPGPMSPLVAGFVEVVRLLVGSATDDGPVGGAESA
ncbi:MULTISPECIES: LysR family transcriptional regulator [Actinoalloteichus]|uniref:Transcriptional regulator n=1 Tax=Actinoalloteichus fjordicus TaxID=1612552 RepID=A0AAC9L8Z9_9PSEU|nr:MULTISPECIES: LysR family transcriptional regulator [Actinoalloteichus]APU13578.1 transcriptional regulator [Actinoalloteichus fjordicus]APU19525.1 transcriptional regulator [Actinoalloteichus sp. GBA129-24]